MSCAWNNYCIAVKQKLQAIEMMAAIGRTLAKSHNTPETLMLEDMLSETSLYMHMDMLIFERDNYITLIGEDMERNGDDWIFYMAEQLRDKNMFEWLRVYMRLPYELKEELKAKIRQEDYEYEKRAGRVI